MDWESKFRSLRKEPEKKIAPFACEVSESTEIPLESTTEDSRPKSSGKTEKDEVLEGLKNLTEEKENETGAGLKVPGGEIKSAESERESEEQIQMDASGSPKKIKVLFVYNQSSDALELPEEKRTEAPSEQLLSRMIKAMKMDESSYEKLVITDGERDVFLKKMAETQVEIVVPMGAVATNLILDKQERISKIHGKFFVRQLTYQNNQVREFQLVPVFNPEMILINPNMKRSTWTDLQKIMEKLGIPLD